MYMSMSVCMDHGWMDVFMCAFPALRCIAHLDVNAARQAFAVCMHVSDWCVYVTRVWMQSSNLTHETWRLRPGRGRCRRSTGPSAPSAALRPASVKTLIYIIKVATACHNNRRHNRRVLVRPSGSNACGLSRAFVRRRVCHHTTLRPRWRPW